VQAVVGNGVDETTSEWYPVEVTCRAQNYRVVQAFFNYGEGDNGSDTANWMPADWAKVCDPAVRQIDLERWNRSKDL